VFNQINRLSFGTNTARNAGRNGTSDALRRPIAGGAEAHAELA